MLLKFSYAFTKTFLMLDFTFVYHNFTNFIISKTHAFNRQICFHAFIHSLVIWLILTYFGPLQF